MGEKSFNLHKNDTKSTQNPIRWKPLETYRPMCQLTSWRNKNDIRPFQHQSSRKLNSISNWCPNKHGCSSKERWSGHGTTNVRQRTLSNPWSHTHHTKKTGHLAFIIKWKVYWLCQNMSCLCWTCVRCCRHLFKHVLVGRANCTCGNVCFLIPLTYYWKERQLHIRPLYASVVRIPPAPLLSITQTKHSQQPPEGNWHTISHHVWGFLIRLWFGAFWF